MTLAKMGDGMKILYCFQAWCPGCHSAGFPSLKQLEKSLEGLGVGFAVIQTVFEGHKQNTPEKLKEMQETYGLRIPFGHDQSIKGYPATMLDYKTGGTPWFIVIGADGKVVYNGFHMDSGHLTAVLLDQRA